jgi:hypothetical protein
MKHHSGPRKTANLSESLHQQLNMYALAASAAGVSLLALTPPAEAKIIYTPAHRIIRPHDSYNIDLNHDGTTDFTIANSVSACTDYCFFELRQWPAAGNSALGYILGSGFLLDSALKSGAPIGPRKPFKHGTAAMAVVRANFYTSNKTIAYGPWVNVKDRFLGLKFRINGKTHFGWARLMVKVSKTTISATLTGYAYETISGKAIKAGQTKDAADDATNEKLNASAWRTHSTPAKQPATLGGLALGAPGLSIWRREESAVGPQ